MMKLNQLLVAGGLAAMLCLSANEVLAQAGGGGGGGGGGRRGGGGPGGGGGFDPAAMQQRMMDRYKEALEIKDDAEWGILQPLIQKVMEARMAVGFGGGRGMFGRGGPGGNNNQGNRPGMAANPDADALQKAIEAKASNAELKGAMEKFVISRKDKQAALEAAQANLRKVLSVRQEAILLSMGTL